MIENLTRVVARDGPWVTVTAASPTGCARCDAGEGCGGGVFGKLIDRRLQGLRLRDEEFQLQPGQLVILGLDDGVFMRATVLTYVLPLLGLLLGALLGAWLSSADLLAVALGLAGFVAGLLASGRLRRRYIDQYLQPKLLRRVEMGEWRCANQ